MRLQICMIGILELLSRNMKKDAAANEPTYCEVHIRPRVPARTLFFIHIPTDSDET